MESAAKIRKYDSLIAFGANQGDCESAWQQAIELFRSDPAILELQHSTPVETEAVTGSMGSGEADANQNKYLNAAIRVLTTLPPIELHQKMIGIEQRLGRERAERWGPRTIDLDLLLVGDLQLEQDGLIVPHPRMSYRRFVLQPALEIAASMVHPASGMTLQHLVEHLNRSENKILIATDAGDFVANLISQINRSLDEDQTSEATKHGTSEIVAVESSQEFMNRVIGSKLVVSCFESDSQVNDGEELRSLKRFAANFAGPTLRLDIKLGAERARIEMVAAIEAMAN